MDKMIRNGKSICNNSAKVGEFKNNAELESRIADFNEVLSKRRSVSNNFVGHQGARDNAKCRMKNVEL
jgi:hypothetical protein